MGRSRKTHVISPHGAKEGIEKEKANLNFLYQIKDLIINSGDGN